jgi:hypothetical protein
VVREPVPGLYTDDDTSAEMRSNQDTRRSLAKLLVGGRSNKATGNNFLSRSERTESNKLKVGDTGALAIKRPQSDRQLVGTMMVENTFRNLSSMGQ